jgi:hypothetical protein
VRLRSRRLPTFESSNAMQFLRRLHMLYIDSVSNPFYTHALTSTPR